MHKKSLVILISSIISATSSYAADDDTLDDVIVTATRTEISTAEAPGSVSVITRKEIEQKGGEDVFDLLRGSAGVSVQGIGSGGRKSISLRGMEGKHTLILVDGKRLPASNDVIGPNTDYQYDWIPVDSIERIEVVRGPMSVLYGADAMGGVINIITRRPGKKLTGSIKLTGRVANGDSNVDGDGHDIEFNLSGSATDTLQFTISAQQARRAALESKIDPGQSAIEGKDKQQVALGIDWQPSENHNIELDYSRGQENRWFDTATRRGTLYQSTYDIDRDQISLGWKGSFGDITGGLRAYRSTVDVVNKATNGVRATAPQQLQDTTIEGNVSFPVGDIQLITAGTEYRTEQLDNPSLVGGTDEFSLNSFYLQDEIDITDDVLITLGARVDSHEAFGSEISPRASVVWNATEQLVLKGSYGHGFRAPTLKQVSPGYSFPIGTFLIVSNPDLQPETNDVFEIGFNYSAENYSVDGAVFNNEVSNLIDTHFDTLLPSGIQQWTYGNIDEARLRGLELSSRIKLGMGFQLSGSYQYLDAKDGNGERLERRPRHTLSAGLTWERNGWSANLNTEYLADQLIENGRTISEVPDYSLWNIGVRKSISKNLDVAAAIENLTDVRLEDESPAFRHEEYPRTLKLELRGKF